MDKKTAITESNYSNNKGFIRWLIRMLNRENKRKEERIKKEKIRKNVR
jgi:hypothetical protein